MVGERMRDVLDRRPIWRQIEDHIDDSAHNARNAPGRFLRDKFPQFPNRNFGGGIMVGVVEAAVAIVLESTLGIPFGSDVEIVDTTSSQGGVLYTINVDSPHENLARARAFFESQVGFTSLVTDLLEVQSVETLRVRPLRDTYQIEILVRD